MKLGIDIGSTTVKTVLTDDEGNILFKKYERHMSNVFSKVRELLNDIFVEFGNISAETIITGSGGLSISEKLSVRFEQEVVCCSLAVKKLLPQTDVAIELGGEDAKITYFGSSIEQRMNGTCAGGTGAFIDQMAILLNTDATGLNEAAKTYDTIYPIAARCGVFAKTDIQPLINEGASMSNLAASIFQAVVNQTISGLACGRKIEGRTAFLGGPLCYMSELRKRFIETLELKDDEIIFPENAEIFVAIGAAYISEEKDLRSLKEILSLLDEVDAGENNAVKKMEPLFNDEKELEEFRKRHSKTSVVRKDLSTAKGPLYLGIDAGSTTTKAALIDKDRNLLCSFYKNNEGNPMEAVRSYLLKLYEMMPEDAYIAYTTVTGYGEGIVKSGFNADYGIIETIAHYKGAGEFLHGVDFILDIGGQDMKCMRIKNGAILSIMLNEACSSGCGSFIETYAKSVELPVEQFADVGLLAKNPVDLGTRCTVFMNSMVKQAQKEGATVADIAAGLSYSVIKNALYKVIKLRNPEEAGDKVVVQGGTFLNESCLRAIEKVLGRDVVRPDIAGIMGAYGCALNSLENAAEGHRSTVLSKEELLNFTYKSTNTRCKGCENNCMLTITGFGENKKYITGNRCEKGSGNDIAGKNIPNLYDYKLERLFSYIPLSKKEAYRGSVGIPRVLNMYENYPFWFTFFNSLGFRVVLSPMTTKEIYQCGMEFISSDTACYPAKIVHGHIKKLIEMGEKWIFYPCLNYEWEEDKDAPNHYNCPVVSGYPEVIANNMSCEFKKAGVTFSHPYLPYDRDDRLITALTKELGEKGIGIAEIKRAVMLARKEQLRFKEDVREEGRRALKYAEDNKLKAIVLSGRPYHLDTEINHGIDKLITSFNMVVLSEDSICDNKKLPRPIRVLDQWVYHSRMYKAANAILDMNNVELVQLNSFGCGVDAVTTDQVMDILENSNKLYTVIKIDEGNNLGAVKIRLRSLKAAMRERERNNIVAIPDRKTYDRVLFTQKMREEYTILIPQMSPLHFDYMEEAVRSCGYNAVLVSDEAGEDAIEEGLKYVNNDACYPTLVTVGKLIAELKSGKYDLDKTALFMSQTGGGCRASNYVAIIRKALKDLKMEQIPVVSFNPGGLESNPGFKITVSMGIKLVVAAMYGDIFQRCLYATRPYEINEGEAEAIREKYREKIHENCRNGNLITMWKTISDIIKDYDNMPLRNEIKPKVGIVGEILVKYHPEANNEIVKIIENEGGEAVVPDLLDFFLYGMYSKYYNYLHLSGGLKQSIINIAGIYAIEAVRKPIRRALRNSKRFEEPSKITHTAHEANGIASTGNQCGEGWLLTGEMIELIKSGAHNIACLQPFACLPNHVTGKGVMKAVREKFPKANIVAIDYDPGASNVNQLNRIKLMMANAKYQMSEKQLL